MRSLRMVFRKIMRGEAAVRIEVWRTAMRISKLEEIKRAKHGARPEDACRGCLWDCMSHPWFDTTILFFIILTCVQLALFNPYDEDDASTHNRVNMVVDLVLMVVFTTEMCIKVSS